MLTATQVSVLKDKYANLPWLLWDNEVPVLILDNHIMSTYRQCEARFVLEFIDGWAPRGTFWFLDFGIVFHAVIEYYYLNMRRADGSKIELVEVLEYARTLWAEQDLEAKYSDHPDLAKLGGLKGFLVLLAQYYGRFNSENERMRVIGAELFFGRKREVPLQLEPTEHNYFRMFLSGKLDLLIDDGSNIGPMDHKTSKDFRGQNPNKSYEIQEGMTGYVYASRQIVKAMLPDAQRTCHKIWMNYAQVKPEPDATKRFSRVPIYKTDYELESYRLRQVRTGHKILSLLVALSEGGVGDRNSGLCDSWFHRECQFKAVHRMNTRASELTILNADFTQRKIWNPEDLAPRQTQEQPQEQQL